LLTVPLITVACQEHLHAREVRKQDNANMETTSTLMISKINTSTGNTMLCPVYFHFVAHHVTYIIIIIIILIQIK